MARMDSWIACGGAAGWSDGRQPASSRGDDQAVGEHRGLAPWTEVSERCVRRGAVPPPCTAYAPDPGGPPPGVLITIHTIMSQALRMAANRSVSTAAAIRSALTVALWVNNSTAATRA